MAVKVRLRLDVQQFSSLIVAASATVATSLLHFQNRVGDMKTLFAPNYRLLNLPPTCGHAPIHARHFIWMSVRLFSKY